jgi:hypothetical protein
VEDVALLAVQRHRQVHAAFTHPAVVVVERDGVGRTDEKARTFQQIAQFPLVERILPETGRERVQLAVALRPGAFVVGQLQRQKALRIDGHARSPVCVISSFWQVYFSLPGILHVSSVT